MFDLRLALDIAGLFLTVAVLLYLFFGDNALFRLVTYFFIGIAAGYVAVLVVFQVLVPRLASLLLSGNPLLIGAGAVLVIFGLLLIFKLSSRFSSFGTLPMAILVGIGGAVAVGGAVFGTLFGQVGGTIGIFNLRLSGDPLTRLLQGAVVLVGVVSTLAYFQFSTRVRAVTPGAEETTARRALSLEVLAKIGQVFIGITLGATFAGVLTAAITALVERVSFMFDVVLNLLRIFRIS